MGISTVVEVGANPKIRRELARLKKEISALRAGNKQDQAHRHQPERRNKINLNSIIFAFKEWAYSSKIEKRLYARLASLEDSIKKSGQGYFRAKLVLPGTTVTAGLDTVEFSCPEHKVEVGVRL